MKVTIGLLGLSAVLIGCTHYQYVTVKSDLPEPQASIAIAGNDTVKIAHEFFGLNGPVRITIHNNLHNPIYVNWRESSLIVKGQRLSYQRSSESFNATLQGSEFRWTEVVSSNFGNASGIINRDEAVSFIPPQSYITETRLVLKNDFFNLPKAGKGDKKNVFTKNGDAIMVKSFSYNSENSPLQFRSFLSFSMGAEKPENALYYDQSFWVCEIVQTQAPPEILALNKDQFYVKKTTGFGNFIGIVGLIGLITMLVVVAE
jgi:hypothetical protein